jgi:outer membrane lipoprotein-sorting protein
MRALTHPSLAAAVLAGALLRAAALAAAPAPLPDPASPKLTAAERLPTLIARVKHEQDNLRTLEANFVQSRASELLVAPEESRGVFYFAAPDSVRWEYQTPNPISMVIKGDRLTTWYQDLGRADQVDVGRYSTQILRYLGAGSSLATLLQYFNVNLATPKGDSQAAFRLDLKPRYERVAKRLSEMTIWLDREHYLPVHLRYVEPNGDVTEYRFSALQVNQPIAADRFDLKLPPGVRVRTVATGENTGH